MYWTDFTRFNKKLKHVTVSSEEMLIISKVVNVENEHMFAIKMIKKLEWLIFCDFHFDIRVYDFIFAVR